VTCQSWNCAPCWVPSPCGRLSRLRTTTDPPPPPTALRRRWTLPAAGPGWASPQGDPGTVPTFTSNSVGRIGARLCPCSLAASTPQASSRPPHRLRFPASESPPHPGGTMCTAARPRSGRFEPVPELEGFPPPVHSRYTLSASLAGPGPSGSAGPSRRCQGCFPPARRTSTGPAALNFTGLLRQPGGGSFHPPESLAPRGAPHIPEWVERSVISLLSLKRRHRRLTSARTTRSRGSVVRCEYWPRPW
jgi:hypothetical protein